METPYYWIRPHGANETLGQLPANNISDAQHLKRVFGGAIVCANSGIDYSDYPASH